MPASGNLSGDSRSQSEGSPVIELSIFYYFPLLINKTPINVSLTA